MSGSHEVTAFSGWIDLVVSLCEAIVDGPFVEARKTLPVLSLSLLFQVLIVFLVKLACCDARQPREPSAEKQYYSSRWHSELKAKKEESIAIWLQLLLRNPNPNSAQRPKNCRQTRTTLTALQHLRASARINRGQR